ncbi:KR domain-containing protein, partial [Pseudomonas aeruginosa]
LGAILEALQPISDLSHQAIQVDFAVPEQRSALVAALDGEIQGVVHSAGISRLCPVRMMSEAHLHEVQSINVASPMLLTQAPL